MEKIYKVTASAGGFFVSTKTEREEINVIATTYQVEKVTEKSIMAVKIIDGVADNRKERFPLDRLNKVRRKEWGDGVTFFTDDPEKISEMVLVGFEDVEGKVQREREAVEKRAQQVRRGVELAEKEGVNVKWQD